MSTAARSPGARGRPGREEAPTCRDLGVTHVIVETRVCALDDMTALLDRFTTDVRSKL